MQITKLRNESGDNTTNLIEIKIVREYYEQLYANKLDNLNEMNTFIERQTVKWLVRYRQSVYTYRK